MKFFLHTQANIRIIKDDLEFNCTPEEFQFLEPEYTLTPEVYWTPQLQIPAGVDCEQYVENIETYMENFPCVYAHVSLSKTSLCINADPPDSILFIANLKADSDPESPNLPVDYSWHIRVSHENGLSFDCFLVDFVQGRCQKSYVYRDGIPLGVWTLDPALFDKIEVQGQSYTVLLVNPIFFTLYRELA